MSVHESSPSRGFAFDLSRQRLAVFAPMVIALVGLGVMAMSQTGRDDTQLAVIPADVDTVITGTVQDQD